MQPNLKESLEARNNSLDDFFCVKSLLLEEKKKKKGDGDSESEGYSGDDEVPHGESLSYVHKDGVSCISKHGDEYQEYQPSNDGGTACNLCQQAKHVCPCFFKLSILKWTNFVC